MRTAGAAALALSLSGIACSPPPPRQEVPAVATVALGFPSAESSSSFKPTSDKSATAPKPEPRQALAWETSEPDARAKARREGMPMIIYLRAEWAVASIRMEREVWSDARVTRQARAFVALKIDVTSAEGDAELYADQYGAAGVPTTILLGAGGARVAQMTGEVEIEALLEAMRRALE